MPTDSAGFPEFPEDEPGTSLGVNNNKNNVSNPTLEELDLGINLDGTTNKNNSLKLAQLVPEEYLYDPFNAEPTLDNLRETALSHSQNNDSSALTPGGGIGLSDQNSHLADLLTAADKDLTLHLARIKAVLVQDPTLINTYSRSNDLELKERAQRLEAMHQRRDELQSQSSEILEQLNDAIMETQLLNSSSKATAGVKTQAALLQTKLAAWEQALQFYIFTTPTDPSTAGTPLEHNKKSLSLLQLLQHLALIAKEDNTNNTQGGGGGDSKDASSSYSNTELITKTLEQAHQMTLNYTNHTNALLTDAIEQSAETYQSYQINLIAHSMAASQTADQTEHIQEEFLHHGKEALKVGHALEIAEAKRASAEQASLLIRRWWMMEQLAEQEEMSGDTLNVEEEVRGTIPSSSCRMDPLFTRVEHSLEAARVLKSLRMVVKCRSSSGGVSDIHDADNAGETKDNHNPTTGGYSSPRAGQVLDPHAVQRFERTNNLLQRTSAALEKRLLNTFSKIYTQGGTYDFSSRLASKRSGRLDWVLLREIAEALMNFDSGRSLHKRYVKLVVTSKFPELFQQKTLGTDDDEGYGSEDSDGGMQMSAEEKQEFDMDATRTKLSTLFHRVCEVCTEEFQLIAHVFSPSLAPHLLDSNKNSSSSSSKALKSSFSDTYPLHVARALLQRVISDPYNGMQAQINELLDGIDKKGDFDAGAKKLDTFVVIHEKAAGLFSLLKEAAQKMWNGSNGNTSSGGKNNNAGNSDTNVTLTTSNSQAQAVNSLIQFLTSQEMALSSGQRRGYLNLELRLLHHECCAKLDRIGARFLRPIQTLEGVQQKRRSSNSSTTITMSEYRAPIMPLDKEYLVEGGYVGLLNGPLKQSVLRQPLIHATDSLARARLMFGLGEQGGTDIDSTARVVSSIFSQMCNFYGQSYLFPIVESLGSMLVRKIPSAPPSLPFDENAKPHDLGVDGNFWISIERIHSAAKAFDRELWAEHRTGSVRVWEILVQTRSATSLTLAKDRRVRFFQELEERGEGVILRALDALSTHIQWILVAGGENNTGTGGTRLLQNFTGQGGGPYAVPQGSLLDSTNSPAVKALTFCLRAQFVHIQAALTPQSLSAFWTALSMRLYDILVARLLQHYYVSTVGAVVLSRDVEALRTVAMLAGTEHSHWDILRELLTLYMTPPDSLRTMLVGAEGDVMNASKGMFGRVGRDQSLVFMSRRVDYRYKTNQGYKKSQWVVELLEELGVKDPTDGRVNIGIYAAENMVEKS